jgi:hypothetical protein
MLYNNDATITVCLILFILCFNCKLILFTKLIIALCIFRKYSKYLIMGKFFCEAFSDHTLYLSLDC